MRNCQDSAPSCWAHVSILKLHFPFKSSLRFLFSPWIFDILELWKAANADVTDLICSLSPSAPQTQSLRCSATWAAKDKVLFFFGQPSQSFLRLPGMAAGVQMCGNWVWNGLFEVELPLCSSVIYPPNFLSLRSSRPGECASDWTMADCYCCVEVQMTHGSPLMETLLPTSCSSNTVCKYCIVAYCANKINHWLRFRHP